MSEMETSAYTGATWRTDDFFNPNTNKTIDLYSNQSIHSALLAQSPTDVMEATTQHNNDTT